jgi:hypothetical protein
VIAALFVQTNGAYYGLDNVDPWDEQRDARTYPGPHPVIAHPPCNRWCKYARVNQTRYGLLVGDDQGCFESALGHVNKYGGVLEHPAQSIAFDRYGLGRPRLKEGWTRSGPGWICEVYQGHYGHRAPKPTWLYAVSKSALPELNRTRLRTGISCTPLTGRESLSKKERSATPIQFRDLLIGIANNAV